MPSLFDRLFSSPGFMPHGHCYLWQSELVWLHVLSDAFTAASYMSIPLMLSYFVRRRRDLPFSALFWAFAAFIVSCGMTHILEIWTLWDPVYWLSGSVKAITAVASLTTAVMLGAFLPRALALPSPAQLQGALDELRRVENRLRAATDGMIENFIILECVRDPHGAVVDFRVVEANPSMLADLGRSRAEAIGGSFLGFSNPGLVGFERLVQVVESRERFEEEVSTQLASDPAPRWLQRQVVPLEDGVAVTTRDITAKRVDDDNLARLASIVESTHDAIIGKSPEGIIESWNSGAQRLYGYSAAEVIGQPSSVIVPPDRASEDRELLAAVQRGQRLDVLDTVRVGKDGERREVSLTASPIRTRGGELVGISTITRDISQQKKSDRLMHAELLLKEVHHRVKNNLQVVSSILKLHAEQMLDPAAQTAFRDSQDRVRAIALLHERLHQSTRLGEVDMGEYSGALIPNLLRAYGRNDISVQVEAGRIALPVDTAVPFGLILNELVTNAIKHAFAGDAQAAPRIDIVFEVAEQDYLLTVRDNGRGFDPGFDVASSERLGMYIVKTLTRQLSGSLSLDSVGGAVCRLRFPMHAEREGS